VTENRRYNLRLRDRFSWYDTSRTQMFHTWAAGTVVTDPSEIALLESAGAPTEKIYEGAYLR
jgi:hypothetical protein